MSPKQRRRDPWAAFPAAFRYGAPPPRDRDALDRMLSEVDRMHMFAEAVVSYESDAAAAAAGRVSAGRDRYRRRLIDGLVDAAHLAHRHLRHDDPDVRREAETLTVGTAFLIGRLYYPPDRPPVAFVS